MNTVPNRSPPLSPPTRPLIRVYTDDEAILWTLEQQEQQTLALKKAVKIEPAQPPPTPNPCTTSATLNASPNHHIAWIAPLVPAPIPLQPPQMSKKPSASNKRPNDHSLSSTSAPCFHAMAPSTKSPSPVRESQSTLSPASRTPRVVFKVKGQEVKDLEQTLTVLHYTAATSNHPRDSCLPPKKRRVGAYLAPVPPPETWTSSPPEVTTTTTAAEKKDDAALVSWCRSCFCLLFSNRREHGNVITCGFSVSVDFGKRQVLAAALRALASFIESGKQKRCDVSLGNHKSLRFFLDDQSTVHVILRRSDADDKWPPLYKRVWKFPSTDHSLAMVSALSKAADVVLATPNHPFLTIVIGQNPV